MRRTADWTTWSTFSHRGRCGATTTELAALMGTTEQAASKLAAAMLDAGHLGRRAGTADGRQRPLHLSARGERLLATVEDIYDELEREWAAVIGEAAVARMRRDLTRAVVAGQDGSLGPGVAGPPGDPATPRAGPGPREPSWRPGWRP